MKTIKKIILISLVALSLGLFACDNNDINNPNNDNPPSGDVILPDLETSKKAVKEEIIYVDIKQNGMIENIKASNKISNTEVSYYEDYGYFLPKGNLNISSPLGEILFPEEEHKALIPSLEEQDNFYYILALEKEKYQAQLPFDIKIMYKLENNIVGYQEIKGATGNVDIKITFTPNLNADRYFKEYFGAQIQIPLSTEHAELIEAKNALTKILAGKTLTLAYMAMPGQELEIDLKIKAKNFKFDGIQATYQQFDINDLMNSFINLEDFDLSQFNKLEDGVSMIVSEFTAIKEGDEGLDQLFNGLEELLSGNLDEFIDKDNFSQLGELINALNDSNFKMGYKSPATAISYLNANRDQLKAKYNNLAHDIETNVDELTKSYENIMDSIDQIEEAVVLFLGYNYQEKYQEFDEIINKLSTIKEKIALLNENEIDLKYLINKKDEVLPIFSDIGTLNMEIKTHFQSLIVNFSSFAFHLSELSPLFDLIIGFGNFIEKISGLKTNLETLVSEIKKDKNDNVFISTIIIDPFLEGIENGSNGNPSLLSALEEVISQTSDFDLSELDQLATLFEKDMKTNLRKVDMIAIGFIEMNKALTLPQEGEEISFYDGLTLFTMIEEVVEFIPDFKAFDESLIRSFLSDENLPPKLVQFVIKQQPF